MNGPAKAPADDARSVEARLRSSIRRICTNDSDALAELYDETSTRLYSLAVSILKDAADAEEVVLDVYQYVWRSAGAFDDRRGSVWSWLSILTRSRAIDRFRAASTRRELHVSSWASLDVDGGTPGPESQTMGQEQRQIVRRALRILSAEERAAVELAFFGGFTHVEVAEKLCEPLGTIKTRIRSAVRKLRDAVEPIFGA